MAGQPKKRKTRELADQAQEAAREAKDVLEEIKAQQVPTAVLKPAGPPAGRSAPRRAPSDAQPRPRVGMKAAIPPGGDTRRFIDKSNADRLEQLARELRPGLSLYIERTKPVWASGWVETVPVPRGGVEEVREYLQEIHGGQIYRVFVMSPDGQPYFESEMKISGLPKRDGEPCTRAKWEGTEPDKPAPVVQSSPFAGTDMGSVINAAANVFGVIIDAQNKQSERIVSAVKEMARSQNENTNRILESVVSTREENKTFAHQLREVVETSNALSEVKDALRDPRDEMGAGPPEEDSLLKEAGKVATAHFMQQVMERKAPAKRTNGKPPAVARKVEIPDAVRQPRGPADGE